MSFDPRTADLKSIKARLEAEGYPEEVIASIIDYVSLERHGYFEAQKMLNGDRGNAEAILPRIREVAKAAEQEVAETIGLFPYEEAALARGLTLHYGDLSRETAEALRKLEGEYNDKSDQEMVPALAAILTPAQLDDYLRYNSYLARTIQFVLSSVDVDQSEYEALWSAAVAREQTTTPNLTPLEQTAHNRTPQAAEDYRAILGDERFLEIITRFDPGAAKADAVYQVAGLSEARRVDLFMEAFRTDHAEMQRINETIGAVRAAGMGSELAQSERERKIQITEELRRSLIAKAGLTGEQVKAFDAVSYGQLLEQMRRTQGFGIGLSVQQGARPARAW